jgi:hypothetical protein
MCCSKQKASSTVVPKGYYQDTKTQIAKDALKRVGREKEEEERDYWFNRLRPMTKPKQMWWEKCLAKEENNNNCDNSGEEEFEVTSTKGDSNPVSGSSNPESGNCNLGGKEDQQEGEPTWMDVNMVFTIPAEFRAPMEDVAELALGAERAVFEKMKNPGAHMKPLFI